MSNTNNIAQMQTPPASPRGGSAPGSPLSNFGDEAFEAGFSPADDNDENHDPMTNQFPTSGKGLMMRQQSAKRFREVKPAAEGITKNSLRRLARRAGVKRMGEEASTDARAALKDYLQLVMRDTVVYTEYAGRKTVTTGDVLHALKRNGQTLYGFGM